MSGKGLILPPTYFYVSMARAEKLIESGEGGKYGEDTIIVGSVEIPNGIGYLVKGNEIKTVYLEYSTEQ